MFYPGLIFVLLVTRLRPPPAQISNNATYDLCSPKAVKTLLYCKFYEYSTFYLVKNISPFYVIDALDLKRVLNT